MRTWARAFAGAAGHVAERPELWLPGALAWLITVGWLVLLVGVARTPSVADLTFLGAGFYTSAAWPWNVISLVGGGILLVVVAALLHAAAEAVLVRGRSAAGRDALRVAMVTLVCCVPVAIALVALGAAVAGVVTAEFTSPRDAGGPIVRVAVRVAPFIVLFVGAAAAGGAIHAAATRSLPRGMSVVSALRSAPGTLRRAGWASVAQAVALLVARIGYLVLGAALVRVLWAPVSERFILNGIDAATVFLLLGFVAIWLCVVLGGGALHATGSASWTRVLETSADLAPGPTAMETSAHP